MLDFHRRRCIRSVVHVLLQCRIASQDVQSLWVIVHRHRTHICVHVRMCMCVASACELAHQWSITVGQMQTFRDLQRCTREGNKSYMNMEAQTCIHVIRDGSFSLNSASVGRLFSSDSL